MSTLVDTLNNTLIELNKCRSININQNAVETISMDYYTNMLHIAKQKMDIIHKNLIFIDDAMVSIREAIKND